MKNLFQCKAILFAGLLFTTLASRSQRIVTSTAGYQVSITIIPLGIVPSSMICPYGYNYNIRFSYLVSFSGTNIPANLYTLQGSIGCGSNNHFFSLPRNGGAGILTTGSNQWRSVPDCATSTIQSLVCSNIVVRISGLGIPSQNVTVPISLVVLPLRLFDFSARQENEGVRVTWQADNQSASSDISLERSGNGTDFETLATNSSSFSRTVNKSEYYDRPPGTGTYYYRLRQRDSNGQTHFSNIRSVRYDQLNQRITVFPVYSKGNTVKFSGQKQWNLYELNVLSMTGNRVYKCHLNSALTILPYLTPGRYILNVVNRKTGEKTNLNYVQL